MARKKKKSAPKTTKKKAGKKAAKKKSPAKKKVAKKAAKKQASPKKKTAAKSHLRQSKTAGFVEKIRENNTMIDYMTRLRVLNPPAAVLMSKDTPRREGGFVRLAHANEEFTAPVLTKGKSITPSEKPAESLTDDKDDNENEE